MLQFPQLSRSIALKTRETTLDPTLRDSYENGMESTRARYTRLRRQWEVSIDFLKPSDVTKLRTFVTKKVMAGALPFTFQDKRDPKNPLYYTVRFSALPSYTDTGNVEGEFRQNTQFQLREV